MNLKLVFGLALITMVLVSGVGAYTTETWDTIYADIHYDGYAGTGTGDFIYKFFADYPGTERIVYEPLNGDTVITFISGTMGTSGTVAVRSYDNPAYTGYMKIEPDKITLTFDNDWSLGGSQPIRFASDEYAGTDYISFNEIDSAGSMVGIPGAFSFYIDPTTIARMHGRYTVYIGGYPIDPVADIEPNADSQLTNHNMVFYDLSTGFNTSAPYPTYDVTFGDGYSDTGDREYNNMAWNHAYSDAGNYTITLTITQGGIPYIDTCNVTIVEDTTCTYDISVLASRQFNIFPLTQYIDITTLVTGTPILESGSSVLYRVESGIDATGGDINFAQFTNVSGTWKYVRKDLGVITTGDTTYADIWNESVRFPAGGNYVIRVGVMPYDQCTQIDEVNVYVNPTSGVNLNINFRDGITGNMLDTVTSIVQVMGVTGNVSYVGNPISIATQIGNNVSIYASKTGYTTKHIYYTIPYPPGGGTTLSIPFTMWPENFGEWYPDNTTWTVTVKSLSTGDPIYGANVMVSDIGGTIVQGYTNGEGYVSVQVPFREGMVLLAVNAVPYVGQSAWYNLGNATEYNTLVYLGYSGTPTPTPSYNYTYTVTPTQTDTPIPTQTTMVKPKLIAEVSDSVSGLPIQSAYVYIYDGDEIDQTYKGVLIYTALTKADGTTEKLQLEENAAYWIVVSKSGYYTMQDRFRMNQYDSTIRVPLQSSGGVTVATTIPTYGQPTPGGGTGIQGGFMGWVIDYLQVWFGVDIMTARALLGIGITLLCAVFVGGALASFGSGSGSGMGALIGGLTGFAIATLTQLWPIWMLPVMVALVGMAFFVWRRGDSD